MKIRNLILLAFGLLPFFAAAQTATFDRVRVRQGLTIRAEKADSIIRAVTALSNHTSIPTAKAVWDAIAAIVAASKYQTLRDDGSNMTQQPAANFVSTGTVAFTLTNDGGNSETEIAAAVPTGGITTTEILDGTIANADISSSANIANSKLANSGVTAGTYPSTGGVIPLLTINSKGIITAVSESANVDASATNEGRLGVGAGGSNDALLTSNTSGATGVTYAGGTGIGISETTNTNGGTITITNTGDTDGTNDLTVSDTTRRVLSSSTHFKYPTAAAVYNAIIAGGTARPDSTWAKSPSGTYTGKRITDNVYRTGKIGIGTTDTTAMLNLRAKNPVGSVLTTVQKISAPPRSAFTDGIFADNSNFTASELDINPMKPNHFPLWNYGIWKEKFTIDSTTNLAVSQPGNAIRQWGFNLDNLEAKLARWYWNTEQLFYPGSGGSSAWEHYLEVYDTLDRHERVMQMYGLHNGNSYEVDFAADDWHIRKPHTTNFALRIRPAVGLWHTDYPYSFRINNATRTGPLMERLHSGTYRNVLDWTTNGRLDVGDSSGVSIQNRLQIVRVNAAQPEIISPEGYVVFDSTRLVVSSYEANHRHITITRPGTAHSWGLNFSADNFFFEADFARVPFQISRIAPTNSFTIGSTGRIAIGASSSYSTVDINQHTTGLDGALRLIPPSGDYAGLFVNGDNELAFNRAGANRMFLTNGGQLKLPSYTSTSSYPITAAGVIGFTSSGEIGTLSYPANLVTGTGTANRVTYWNGTNSITSSDNFSFNGTKVSANTGTAISTYLSLNPNNNASSTVPNGGLTLFDNGTSNLYGLDMGYGVAFGPRLFTAASADINFAKVVSGSAPTAQSDFANMMTIKGSTGNVGIGTTSPDQTLHVSGNARVTGAYYDSTNDPGSSAQVLSSTVTGTDWVTVDTNPSDDITGSGTTNYIAKFTAAQVLGNSVLFDNGTNVGIGTASPLASLQVNNGNIGAYNSGGANIYIGDPNFDNSGFYNKAPGIGAVFNAGQGVTSDLGLYTYNGIRVLRAIILSGGEFGIGTATPSEKLHVSGNTRTDGTLTTRGTGTSPVLHLHNTTGGTGRDWTASSYDGGNFAIGHSGIGNAIEIDGATEAVIIDGPVTLSTATGTGTDILARTAAGVVTVATLGSGLSLSGGTLSATGGGGGGNYQTLRDDGTDKTQRAAANFVSTATVAAVLTDDAGNGETEIALNIPDGAIQDEQLAATGVTAGSYTSANITVDADGRVTAAANGSAPSGTILQGGNSFGTAMTIGTNDAQSLNLEVGGVTVAQQDGTRWVSYGVSTAGTSAMGTTFFHNTEVSGTPAAGFGGALEFGGESSTSNYTSAAKVGWQWTTATHASRTSELVFHTVNSGTMAERMSLQGNGTLETTRVTMQAGTSAAGTAPLKFTSGTNLATPESGAVEFDGTNYYASASSTRYTLAKTLTATASLNFPSTGNGDASDLTITVPGAASGDVVSIGVPSGSIPAKCSYFAWVSATNTVTVRFFSLGGTNDPASGTFRATIVKY